MADYYEPQGTRFWPQYDEKSNDTLDSKMVLINQVLIPEGYYYDITIQNRLQRVDSVNLNLKNSRS